MNRILLFLAMLATMTGTASAAKTKVKPKTDSVFIFTYSDNPHQGIKLAVSNDGKNSIRQMNMLSCDYGPWGAEKSVFTPYLYRKTKMNGSQYGASTVLRPVLQPPIPMTSSTGNRRNIQK